MFPSNERTKTKYIGREKELSLLNDLLAEVRKGSGKLVMVEGEAGIGKTRLIEEMRGAPNFSDFNYLSGRCLYFKDTDIYLPFKEMHSQYRRIKKGKDSDETSPFNQASEQAGSEDELTTPTEQEFVPMSLIPAEIDLEEVEEEGMVVEGLLEFDKLSHFIFELLEEGPLCLFIDDLHWADPPSIKLLQFLASKLSSNRLIIICTYRPEDLFWGEEDPHPLTDPLKHLSREKHYVTVELKKLGRKESDIMIRNILGIERTPKSFGDLLFKRTGGNPFFIEEIIYSLLERDIIDPSAPEWADNIDPDTISLPTTLKDVILRRIHWLKGNSMSVIRLASVSGPRVTFDIIKDALEMKEEDILEALEELVQAKFLREIEAEESYEFENPVIQEVIYTELNHSRRRFLHLKMGKVLEERYSNNPTVWGSIANHYYKGKDLEKALLFLTKASSYYQQISPVKTLEYLHMVLDCTERLPQSDSIKTQHLEVLLEISHQCLLIGDWKRAGEFSEKALNLSAVLRKPLEGAKAKGILAEIGRNQGDYDKGMQYYQETLNIPHERGSSEIIARSYMGMGYISWRKGDFPKALEMFSKSLQYAKIENNLNTIGALYINIGNVFNHRGDSAKALDYYNRGVKHLENIGNFIEASRGYSNIGNVHIQLGELEEAEKALEKSNSMAKEKGKSDNWWPNLNMILLMGAKGKFNEAKELFETCVEHMKEKNDQLGMGVAHLYYGSVTSRKDMSEEAETLLLRAHGIFEGLGVAYDLGRAKYELGEHYIRISRFEEGKDYLDNAYSIFKSIGAKSKAEMVRERLLQIRDGDGFI
ncbi:MAG: tetratricopeptide repeat protein [Thermoplasmatota archaeon]